MPQMSPMNWYVLYFFFSAMFYLTLNKLHFTNG
uniref:Adenosine triphosphatase subunit 8 n=1 Tax=Tigriopus japonicus TaxID=158387 RepID=Q8M6U0_TIGJA|nr:adenosine triphosphatase subunit 8 [Tigriopus japonicus]